MEKYLKDACLDLIVRKHVYNCSRISKAADHGTCRCENMYIVHCTFIWERVQDGKKQEWQKCPVGYSDYDVFLENDEGSWVYRCKKLF